MRTPPPPSQPSGGRRMQARCVCLRDCRLYKYCRRVLTGRRTTEPVSDEEGRRFVRFLLLLACGLFVPAWCIYAGVWFFFRISERVSLGHATG